MGRVSRAQAEENRRRVVETASRLFREQGAQNVSVADVMKAAGLTHGGFYKQFASKEALLAEATAAAFQASQESPAARWYEADERRTSPCADEGARRREREAARTAILDEYLSAEHRDAPGDGCAIAGFLNDVVRGAATGEARETYLEGVQRMARRVAPTGVATRAGAGAGTEAGPVARAGAGGDADGDGGAGLANLATMVGAVLLARATCGSPLSDDILAAARKAIG